MAQVKKIKVEWHQSLIKCIKRNKNGEDIKLFPKKPLRDFVYVKDIVTLIFMLLKL